MTLFCLLLQLVKDFLGFGSLPRHPIGVAKERSSICFVGDVRSHRFSRRDCLLKSSFRQIIICEMLVDVTKVSIQLQRLLILFHCLFALAGGIQDFPQVDSQRLRKRIKLNGPFYMGDGLINSPMGPKDSGVVCVNISRVWIKFERALKLSERKRPVCYCEGQGRMSVSERIV